MNESWAFRFTHWHRLSLTITTGKINVKINSLITEINVLMQANFLWKFNFPISSTFRPFFQDCFYSALEIQYTVSYICFICRELVILIWWSFILFPNAYILKEKYAVMTITAGLKINGIITWDDATWILSCSFMIFTMQTGKFVLKKK